MTCRFGTLEVFGTGTVNHSSPGFTGTLGQQLHRSIKDAPPVLQSILLGVGTGMDFYSWELGRSHTWRPPCIGVGHRVPGPGGSLCALRSVDKATDRGTRPAE